MSRSVADRGVLFEVEVVNSAMRGFEARVTRCDRANGLCQRGSGRAGGRGRETLVERQATGRGGQ